jgi:uncharacterized protein (DUF1684 family)
MSEVRSTATGTATSTADDAVRADDAVHADAGRDHAAWRAARERELREPHGWLSLTALLWPTATPGRLPGVPGEWWVANGTLFTRPAAGDTAVLVGEHVEPEGPTPIGVREGRSRILGTFLPEGRDEADDEHEVAVEVVLRTGRYAIRLRDPQAATRTAFDGVPAFDHDPAWVLDVPVRWYDEPEPVTVGAAQPRLVHHVEVVGEADVTRDGTVTTVALTGSLTEPTLLFSDEADGLAPWRVLRASAPDATPATSGTLRLDLNRATNLPYAFTEFGTCPAPLSGNHLPFAVTAGEKAPR